VLQTSLQQAAIDRWLQHGTRCTVASFRFWPQAAPSLGDPPPIRSMAISTHYSHPLKPNSPVGQKVGQNSETLKNHQA